MQELREGIFSWSVWRPGSYRGVSFNGHYLVRGEERVVIDPPPLNEWELEHMVALGAPTLILVTNASHLRAAPALKERFPAARLLVPAADRAAVAAEVDGTFSGGEVLAGLEVIALEDQKSPGESCLYDAEAKLLIVGDALIGTPRGALRLLPEARYADPARARAGLRILLERPVETLLCGDGGSILSGADEALRAFFREVPEVALVEREHGKLPDPEAKGWYVLNLGEAEWLGSDHYGAWAPLEGGRGRFGEVGVNVTVVQPGQAACLYHRESAQEGFLVLSGEARLVVEGEERPLRAWDYFHCPPGVGHVLVGAGEGPAAILMLGARPDDCAIEYPVEPAAAPYGASVQTATEVPMEAYGQIPGLKRPQPAPFCWPLE